MNRLFELIDTESAGVVPRRCFIWQLGERRVQVGLTVTRRTFPQGVQSILSGELFLWEAGWQKLAHIPNRLFDSDQIEEVVKQVEQEFLQYAIRFLDGE